MCLDSDVHSFIHMIFLCVHTFLNLSIREIPVGNPLKSLHTRPPNHKVFRELPAKVQVALLSATMPADLLEVTKNFMQDLKKILVKTDEEWEGCCHEEVLLCLHPSADHHRSAGPRNQCSVVINYDIMNNLENSIHRIWQGGRFGRKGVAIAMETGDSQHILRYIFIALKSRSIQKMLPIKSKVFFPKFQSKNKLCTVKQSEQHSLKYTKVKKKDTL